MKVHYRTPTGPRLTACGRKLDGPRPLVASRHREQVDCQRCQASIEAALRPPAETEAGFAGWFEDLATVTHWRWYHTHDSRRSVAGFPDYVLVKHHQILFVELKREGEKLRPDQQEWNRDLGYAAGLIPDCNFGNEAQARYVTVAVWRPSDRPEIEYLLRGRR